MTRHLKTPLLVMQAGDDKIVSNEAQIKLMKKLAKTNTQCAFTIVQGAKHELFFEQDEYRNQALEHTLTFLEQH
jgi:lysophospholipase